MDKAEISNASVRSSYARLIAKTLMLLLLAALLFCVGLLVFMRVGMDGNQLGRLVIPRLESQLDKTISVASVELGWLSAGTARISLSGLEVRDRGANTVELRVSHAELEIDCFSIAKGQVVANLVRISEPVVFVPPPEEVLKRLKAKPEGGGFTPPPIFPVIRRLEITNGRLALAAPAGSSSPSRGLLSGIEVTATATTSTAIEQFTAKAVASDTATGPSLVAEGRLDSNPLLGEELKGEARIRCAGFPIFPLRLLSAYLNYQFPLSEGGFDLDATIGGNTENFQARGEITISNGILIPGNAFFRDVPLDRVVGRFTAGRSGDGIRIDIDQLGLPGIKVSAQVMIRNPGLPNASVEITIRDADLDLQKIFPLIPFKLMKNDDRERFVEAGLKGHLLIAAATWKGPISDLLDGKMPPGAFFIDAYLEKVSGFIPAVGLPVTNATGSVRSSADEMIFKGISLTLGSSPLVLNGWVSDVGSSPRTDLFVTLTAQGQDLKTILESKALAGHIQPWLYGISEPQGSVSITMDVKGDLKQPNLKGRVVLEDFQCRLSQFPLPLRKVSGSLRFRGSGVAFSGLKGIVGDTLVDLSGTVSPENIDVASDLKVSAGDLRKLNVLSEEVMIKGNIGISLAVKGPWTSTGFSAKADLKGNVLHVGSSVRKNSGVPMELGASGSFNSDGISIDDGHILTNGTRVAARATVDKEGKAILFLNLPPKGISTNALIPLVNPAVELQPGGRIEGDAVIKIGPVRSRDVHVDSNLVLSHVSMRLGFHKRVDGITGNLRLRGKSLNATMERARIGNTEISGTISIADFDSPRVEMVLESPFLDTTDFTSPPGYVSTLTWAEWIRSNAVIRFLARSRGVAQIKAAKGKTTQRAFTQFQAQFEGAQGFIRVPHWQLGFADGVIRGKGLFDIRSDTSTPLTLELQGDQLKMERIFTSDPERVRMEGAVTVEGRLEWKTNDKREDHGIYKKGRLDIRVHNGVIERFEVLSKIFSLVNFGSLVRGRFPDVIAQGLPFQRISWTADVFDKKWRVTDLKLDSDAAHIDASGSYFSDQDRVDFRVNVAPLVGLDTIVSGLLGNLLTRDGKTLVWTVRVSGLSGSPDVRLELFRAAGN
jgi:hypothetical protein